jgi:hypothetical protein
MRKSHKKLRQSHETLTYKILLIVKKFPDKEMSTVNKYCLRKNVISVLRLGILAEVIRQNNSRESFLGIAFQR